MRNTYLDEDSIYPYCFRDDPHFTDSIRVRECNQIYCPEPENHKTCESNKIY